MRKILAISLVLLVAIVTTATIASARDLERKVPMLEDLTREGRINSLPGGVFGVSAQGPDTFYYGGTQLIGGEPYAVPPLAAGWVNRKMWTWSSAGFNGTPHTGLNMDGWKGVDNTAQQENYFYVADTLTMGHNCVIAGDKSLFCGATNQQCKDLCYVDQIGTGYGNNWNQTVVTKTYTYAAGNQIQLDYDYHNESEAGFDSTLVILQILTTPGGWVDHALMAGYTDNVTAHQTLDIDSYMSGLTPPVSFRIKFNFKADGGYSDEDGANPTVCGGFELDNYALSGDVVDSETFEAVANGSLPAGWLKVIAGYGDYAHAKHLNDLSVGLDQDPCVATLGSAWCEIADSVLVFFDESTPAYPHPLHQDNYARSPIIDFSTHPGVPGRIFQSERFGALPLNDHIFMQWRVRYKPGCASGGWSPWLSDNYVYYTAEGTSCRPFSFDISTYVPPEAEQAQLGLGVLSLCAEDPWKYGCTHVCNVSPYYDNVTFGVYGSDVSPYISMRELDYWQDQFAEDGTLNPTSTADSRTSNYESNLIPPIFGDTLVCRAAVSDEEGAEGIEVRLVFKLDDVGPGQAYTHPFFTTWFPTVATGAWQEARMDIARVTNSAGTGTLPSWGSYMACFHALDPVRIAHALPQGTEILPNNIFTPGASIEYFVKARYVPSGPWFYLPDTTWTQYWPEQYEEFDVFPGFKDDGHGSYTWPCLLVADHFGQRGNYFMRNADRIDNWLDYKGIENDVWRKFSPTSAMRNGIGRWAVNPGQIGGPGTDKYNWGPGATLAQLLAYTHCFLNAGNVYGYSMYQQDADMISSWLNVYSSANYPKFFWLSGDQVTRELNRRTPWGKTFLNSTLCVTQNSAEYNYAGLYNDYTYCLPIKAAAGGRVTGAECVSQFVDRQNGCARTLCVIGVSGAAGCNGLAERYYDTHPTAYAAVSNLVSVVGGANFKTFTEGYDDCAIRTDASLGFPACGTDTVYMKWLDCVLEWGGLHAPGLCDIIHTNVNPNSAVPPAVLSSLAQAYPNPMNPTATIMYTVGTPGKVMLRIFDVTGRVIRTLVDEPKTTGRYSVIWDGSNDRGEKVASGVFFYQLNAPGFSGAKKIVILQ